MGGITIAQNFPRLAVEEIVRHAEKVDNSLYFRNLAEFPRRTLKKLVEEPITEKMLYCGVNNEGQKTKFWRYAVVDGKMMTALYTLLKDGSFKFEKAY